MLSKKEIEVLIGSMIPEIRKHIQDELEPLRKRLNVLEKSMTLDEEEAQRIHEGRAK